MSPEAPQVLFLCVHNAGRSQMAAALMERASAGRVRVLSAGSEPTASLHPAVLDVMGEIGIDLTDRQPTRVTDEMARSSQVVITMGCGDACPYYPGTRYVDWPVEDPSGKSLDDVRAIRDEIAERVAELLAELRPPLD